MKLLPLKKEEIIKKLEDTRMGATNDDGKPLLEDNMLILGHVDPPRFL